MRFAHTLRSFAAAAVLLAGAPAQAAFHLFSINEIYSNADGTLQFVEMTALAGGQQFMTGHTLRSSSGGSSRTITLNTDLPGDTANRRVLFATAGVFTAFGIVPDYIIPEGFLFTAGGTINWEEGSDIFTHGAMPTDGATSLARGGGTAAATPQNFAGVIGQPPSNAPATYQALWWAGEAESGWGVNVTHQGDILFATWFTYDTDGSPMWLILSRGDKTANGVYTGQLFRTTGPVFSAVPFNPNTVAATAVGTATFTFTSTSQGTFAYTVNGISQTKNVIRQEFSSPVPTCFAGGTASTIPNYQALWWLEAESGWGLNVVHQGDVVFATWFTYAADGKGQWLILSRGDRTPGTQTFTGQLFRTRGNAFNSVPWNPSSVVATPAGNATLTFTDRENGTFNYTLDGVTQTKAITRQGFSSPLSVCRVGI